MFESAATAIRLPTTRSRLSNDLFAFRGDARSTAARRFRDVMTALVDELGGEATLGEASRLLIRQAATLTVRLETLQAAVVGGGEVNDEDLVRIANVLARTLSKLRAKRPASAPAETLKQYLARREAEREREAASRTWPLPSPPPVEAPPGGLPDAEKSEADE